MLMGLLKPTSICYASLDWVWFPNSVLDARLTVLENLTIRAKQYKSLQVESERLVSPAVFQPLSSCRTGHFLVKRRVDIARALLNSPRPAPRWAYNGAGHSDSGRSIWSPTQANSEEEQMTILTTYLNEADVRTRFISWIMVGYCPKVQTRLNTYLTDFWGQDGNLSLEKFAKETLAGSKSRKEIYPPTKTTQSLTLLAQGRFMLNNLIQRNHGRCL